jgi:Valyl-tRNA synthetase
VAFFVIRLEMLDKTYDPQEIEARRYPEWEQSGAFRAHPEST